jgi:endonuclease-3
MSKLFQKYKTVDDIIALGIEGLQEHIKSIGLYRNKSKNIVALSKILKEKYDNKIPDSREKLEILPGVGRKSANVILNTLFNQNTIAVDTHVLRVTNRLNLSNSNNPLKVESDLESIIPSKYKKNISNLLVLHGRYVCKAKRPLCENCVINKLCHARKVKK